MTRDTMRRSRPPVGTVSLHRVTRYRVTLFRVANYRVTLSWL